MFFPTMYLLHLHLGFRVALGFILLCRLTHLRMPDAVPVRKVSGLPRASFRFRLATDTLAFGYALGATSCARDLHPLDHAHAGRTKEKANSGLSLCLPKNLSFLWCRQIRHACEAADTFFLPENLLRATRMSAEEISLRGMMKQYGT